MRTNKKKTSKPKIIVIILVAMLTLGGGYSVYAYAAHLWPFQSGTETTSTPEDSTQNTDNSPPADNEETPTTDNGDEKPDTQNQGNYISPDITSPPSDNTPYPIENERYRIDRLSGTHFSVELYPIVNNPTTSDYKSQLKDYKNQVLTYLKKRHGNIDNIKIDWLPEDAQNI